MVTRTTFRFVVPVPGFRSSAFGSCVCARFCLIRVDALLLFSKANLCVAKREVFFLCMYAQGNSIGEFKQIAIPRR